MNGNSLLYRSLARIAVFFIAGDRVIVVTQAFRLPGRTLADRRRQDFRGGEWSRSDLFRPLPLNTALGANWPRRQIHRLLYRDHGQCAWFDTVLEAASLCGNKRPTYYFAGRRRCRERAHHFKSAPRVDHQSVFFDQQPRRASRPFRPQTRLVLLKKSELFKTVLPPKCWSSCRAPAP